MTKTVAIEENLTNVNQALQSQGFNTIWLENEANLTGVGAIVVSGQNSNFLGMHDTNSKVPVINAAGLSADQVVDAVKSRMV